MKAMNARGWVPDDPRDCPEEPKCKHPVLKFLDDNYRKRQKSRGRIYFAKPIGCPFDLIQDITDFNRDDDNWNDRKLSEDGEQNWKRLYSRWEDYVTSEMERRHL